MSWVGVGLTLPCYGAETFGLAAIGHAVYGRGDPSLLAVADAVRAGPGLALLATGLVLLALGAAMVAAAIWTAEGLPRWSGVPLTIGLHLYQPQFLASQPARIGHGALMALGCLLVARTAAHAAFNLTAKRSSLLASAAPRGPGTSHLRRGSRRRAALPGARPTGS